MNSHITYTRCPVCNSILIKPVLDAIDYTVSKEKFSIWQCNNCTCRFTQKVPSPQNIAAYYSSEAYVSHSDTKKGLINRLYHIIRNYTIKSKIKLVTKTVKRNNGLLLDIGAGTGAFAAAAQNQGWKVTGLEPDETAKQNAKKKFGLTLQPMDDLFSFPSQQFDAITLWHVLEHVHRLPEYISTFRDILKDEGVLIIAVPNYTAYDAKVYQQYWAAYDVPRHLYHFSPLSMQVLMEQNGFKITKMKLMWFDSFYVSMLSERYKNGQNNFLSAVYTGLRSNIKAINKADKCSSVIYIIQKVL